MPLLPVMVPTAVTAAMPASAAMDSADTSAMTPGPGMPALRTIGGYAVAAGANTVRICPARYGPAPMPEQWTVTSVPSSTSPRTVSCMSVGASVATGIIKQASMAVDAVDRDAARIRIASADGSSHNAMTIGNALLCLNR